MRGVENQETMSWINKELVGENFDVFNHQLTIEEIEKLHLPIIAMKFLTTSKNLLVF